jgi:hypothetical protein
MTLQKDHTRSSVIGFLLLTLLLIAPQRVRSTDGRDFTGSYEISNVTEQGDTVRLTLTVHVYNYSDADVAAATVTLQDLLVSATNYGSYPETVSIPDRQSVRLSAEFTVPYQEYDRWQRGATPSLRIEYTNVAENPVRRMIELGQGQMGEE